MQSNQSEKRHWFRLRELFQNWCRNIAFSSLVLFGTQVAATADWRTDIGVFRIGIVVGEDVAENLARVEPFRLALAEALSMKVEIFPARNISSLIEAHRSLRIEYAVYSTIAYAATWVLCECVEPLVLPQAADQTSAFRSVIIATPQGPRKLTDLKEESLAISLSRAVGAREIAAYELKKQGLPLKLTPLDELGTSEEAVNALLEGRYQALLGWSSMVGNSFTGYSRGSLKAIADKNGGEASEYKVIWQSSDIPHPPHAIQKSLPAEAKEILSKTLQNMFAEDPSAYDSIELQYGGGFEIARHEQFSNIIQFVRAKTGIVGASSEVTGEAADTDEPLKD